MKKDLGRDDATQIPRVQQLDVLGSVVVATGSCMPGLDHRLDRATMAFHVERHILLDKAPSKTCRSAHYVKYVVPVALYTAVQWSFSVANVRRLMTWEAKLLRRMFAVRPWPLVTYAFYIQRVTRSIRAMFYRFGHLFIMQSWIFRIHYAATLFPTTRGQLGGSVAGQGSCLARYGLVGQHEVLNE